MKVYMKPIRMIAYFEPDGLLSPIRFQMPVETHGDFTIKIDRIVEKSEERLAGNRMFIYRCESTIASTLKVYEIKYELSTCKWYLYKM